MSTSLAEQLKKLRAPQTTLLTQDKRKPSFLFDAKEAANLDRDTVYNIGISGLEELIKLNGVFSSFKQTLFAQTSINLERSVQDKSANKKLNAEIERFLVFLLPYFQVNVAHRALEWVIHRFHIHQFNKDQFILFALPYHYSKIFVRALQLLELSDPSDKWHWLYSLQKTRSPLPTSVLVSQIASDNGLLKIICTHVLNATEISAKDNKNMSTLYDFYASSVLGCIDKSQLITDVKLNYILPSLLKGLSSKMPDYAASAYAILAKLMTKVSLRKETIDLILLKCCKKSRLKQELILLLIFLYDNNLSDGLQMSDDIMLKLSDYSWFVETVINIKSLKVQVTKFIIMFLVTASNYIINNSKDDVDTIKNQIKEIFAKIQFEDNEVLEILKYTLTENVASDRNPSDLANFFANLYYSYEVKYPNIFDKYLRDLIQMKENNKTACDILHFLMSWECRRKDVSDSLNIFTKLNHATPEQRILAIETLGKQNSEIPENLKSMVRQSLKQRFNDDSIQVVKAFLNLPAKLLQTFFDKDTLTKELIDLVSKCHSSESKQLRRPVLKLLLGICEEKDDIEVLLCIVPFLFPLEDSDVDVALEILNSKFATRNVYLKSVVGEIGDVPDAKTLRDTAYHHISIHDHLPPANDVLNSIKMQSSSDDDAVSKFFKMIILGSVCRVPVGTLSYDIARKTIELAAEIIKSYPNICPLKDASYINRDKLSESLGLIYKGILPLQVNTYALEQVHRRLDIKDNPKLDFENDKERSFLILRILEITFESMILETWRTNYGDWRSHYEWFLNIFFGRHFISKEDIIIFLSQLFNEPVKSQTSFVCLSISLELLSGCQSYNWLYEDNTFIINLLIALGSKDTLCRNASIEILKKLSLSFNVKPKGFSALLAQLMEFYNEILIDHTQLPLILYTILSPDADVSCHLKKEYKEELAKARKLLFKAVVDEEIPIHTSSQLLQILSYVNGPLILENLVPYCKKLLTILKNDNGADKNIFCQSLLKNILKRFDSSSITALKQESVKDLFMECLVDYKTEVLGTKISTIILKQIDEQFFNKLKFISIELKREVLGKLIDIGTDCEIDAVLSVATKTIKKIAIDAQLVADELRSMTDTKVLEVNAPKGNVLKKRMSDKIKVDMPPELLNTRQWKRGVTLLQFIQDSNNIENEEALVDVIFLLLSKCLQFEEQSPVEYTNQLLLSIIYNFTSKSVPIKNANAYVDLIAQCIRTSQNPQTHHHALLVLVEIFKISDIQNALQNIMPIFTFVGNSVLRQDDAYSIQIITKTIETVVPVINAGGDEKYACEILRLFVTSLPDIPEHRRIPLFLKLLQLLENYLHLYYILTFEGEVLSGHLEPSQKKSSQRISFALLISQEFSVKKLIEICVQIVKFLKDLPIEIDNKKKNVTSISNHLFNPLNFTPKHLRHYKFTIVRFLVSLLSAPNFINRVAELSAEEVENLEPLYDTLIIEIIMLIQTATKNADLNKEKLLEKYWKVTLHVLYDVLDLVNNLLPNKTFISGISRLIHNDLLTVRRKALELLNTRLQQKKFDHDDHEELLLLVEPLVGVLDGPNKFVNPELETIQQTALISLKLLAKILGHDHPDVFKPILNLVTELMKSREGPVFASAVLCVAELCSTIRVHSLQCLNKFMPQIIKSIQKYCNQEIPDIISMSIISALQKIVESIGNFLSLYLDQLLHELSRLNFLYISTENPKVGAISSRLKAICQKLSSCTPLRVLLPAVNKSYKNLLETKNYQYVSPLMNILGEAFANMESSELNPAISDLGNFFLSVLQFREEINISKGDMEVDGEVNVKDVALIEESASKALVALVLKLSESTFRPLYYKLYDWAARNPQHKQRNITFYRLSANISECLKSLFVLFAGHFLKHAATLLNSNNILIYSQEVSETTLPDETSQIELIEEILLTLSRVFSYDAHDFINQERFETLMQPIVDQIENTIGSRTNYEKRAKDLIVPCIASFVNATPDDSLHKKLVYQVLLKTRHAKPYVRSSALSALVEIVRKLGEDFMPLLPETVPFLAELLEDEDEKTEKDAQNAVRTMEEILGEPLQKYF